MGISSTHSSSGRPALACSHLSTLKAPERRALRTAVVDRLPPASLTHSDDDGSPAAVDGDGADGADEEIGQLGDTEGARLVRLLRGTGRAGGIEIDEASDLDGDISLYLFSDQPVAIQCHPVPNSGQG